jgi:single-strand DNA-binding protein
VAYLNRAQILGNLGQDPVMRFVQSGDPVTNFSVATTRRWKDPASGEQREETTWHNIVAWRRLAEIANEYLRKGRQVYVEGHIQNRSYEQDGVKKYRSEIVAENIQLIGAKSQEGEGEGSPAESPVAEDDIPF